ncbi:hypothetical protein BY996DRAFT_6475370 [Phakopsora pachyrhizi]|nr:hypothetical protein BY996DRAFT_6475370 [Phakopsora pachyrhizi]
MSMSFVFKVSKIGSLRSSNLTWSYQQHSQVKNLPATIFPTRAVPKDPKTTDRQLTKRSCAALEYGWHAKEDEPGQPGLPIGVETEDLMDQFCPEGGPKSDNVLPKGTKASEYFAMEDIKGTDKIGQSENVVDVVDYLQIDWRMVTRIKDHAVVEEMVKEDREKEGRRDFEEEGVAVEKNRWRHWKEEQMLGGGAYQGQSGWSKTKGATDL